MQRQPAHTTFSTERGAVLIVLLVVVVMGSLAILLDTLGRLDLSLQREELAAATLNRAKEALIAYAVSNNDRPGNLPCPDRHLRDDPDYGKASSPCSSSGKTSIGRLPWKDLGIPELLDPSGQPLWYALSDNFRTTAAKINSDTAGSLTVYGPGDALLTPANDRAVAMVFAPGTALGNQARSTTQAAFCNTTGTSIVQFLCADNYLETVNGRNNASAAGPYVVAPKTDTFNDQTGYLTASQLMGAIEKRVAKEMGIGMKQMLNTYFNEWKAYPYAASFSDPSSATFDGVTANLYGLLPIRNIIDVAAPYPLAWKTSPAPRYYIDGVDTGACSPSTSSGSPSNNLLRCGNNSSPYTTIPAGKTITFTATLQQAGLGIWRSFSVTDTNYVTVRRTDGTYVKATDLLANPRLEFALNPDGSANITFAAEGKSGGSTIRRVQINIYRLQTGDTSQIPTWYFTNNWHHFNFYAVSEGYAARPAPACEPLGTLPHVLPYCLTLEGTGSGTDKRALLVFTGRALSSQQHPSNSLADYLEGRNAAPAAGVYENRPAAPGFNDIVVPLAP